MIRARRFGLTSTISAALLILAPSLSARAATESAGKAPAPQKVQAAAPEALLPPGTVGAYLAARLATRNSDYAAAAHFTGELLARNIDRPAVMETAIQSDVVLGRFDEAAKIARKLQDLGIRSQVAELVLIADKLDKGQYAAVLTDLSGPKGDDMGGLVKGLITAWADLGAGKMSEATTEFDKLSTEKGMEAFGLYHKALALASVGDFEGAEKIFGDSKVGLRLTRRGVIARVEVLSQLEQDPKALGLLNASFSEGRDPEIDALREKLKAGDTLPFTVVRNAKEGAAEVFYTIASSLQGQASRGYVLLFSQIALHLRPQLTGAALLSADLLDQEKQYALALKAYDSISPEDPSHYIAQIGRADTLYSEGSKQEATEILAKLSKAYPKVLQVQVAYGDILRRQHDWTPAIHAYDAAIALIGPDPKAQQWSVFYLRGIAEEQAGDWAKAEPDLREALRLNPDQPDVLNYLGYAMVDRGEKLDEALAMIKKAVSERPEDGYIRDSLGWAYYKLGQYGKALTNMEKASQLEPVDPIVTDHLGDVYWVNGRKLEAQFQWRRALSYGPDEADAKRIRLKLEKGLDAVLKEEGKTPPEPAKASNPAPGAGATNGG